MNEWMEVWMEQNYSTFLKGSIVSKMQVTQFQLLFIELLHKSKITIVLCSSNPVLLFKNPC